MAVHFPADINVFACVCIDYSPAAPKDKAVLRYCLEKLNGNFIASAEHEKTLKVMMKLEQLIGQRIVWVRGKSFDKVIDEAGCLPTWARRFCTTEMKILPIFEYCYFNHGPVQMNIGFRADERDRMKVNSAELVIDYPVSCKNYKQQRQNWKEIYYGQKHYPLYKTFHHEIRQYWQTRPDFDFPFDSNCQGCHHKPSALINANYRETPEILEWFSIQEEKGKYNTWHDDRVPYAKVFNTDYQNLFSGITDFTMCNSGGCTD